MKNTGDIMTIFANSRTFLSSTLAFTDGKSSLPQWANYCVLQVKRVCYLGIAVALSLQYLFMLLTGLRAAWLSWEEDHLLFIPLSQMQKSRCAYVLCLTSFFSAGGLKHLLETVLRTFHCRKGFTMLEYKYNIGAVCNAVFQNQNLFSKVGCSREFRN